MTDLRKTFLDRCVRDKRGVVTVAQRPNLPLAAWIATWLLALLLHGRAASVVRLIGDVALAAWALLEILQGANYFRRLLGTVVLIMLTLMVVIR